MRATSLGVKNFDLWGMPQAFNSSESCLLPLIQLFRLLSAPSGVAAFGK